MNCFRFQFISNRYLFSSFYCSVRPNSNVSKSKTMQKLLNKANRKKDTKWYTPPFAQAVTLENGNSGKAVKPKRRYSDGMLRRAKYVSTVMHEAVSQIVGTGELGVSVTVEKVEVLPDMSHMNIYWQGSGNRDKDRETQLALDAKIKVLRHTLIHSHTLGNVPRPVFVKDLTASRQMEVEEILNSLNMSETAEKNLSADKDTDLVCTFEIDSTNSEFKTIDSSKSELKTINLNEESDNNICLKHEDTSDNHENENAASFRQDLYGLHHDVLTKKILDAKKIARQRPEVKSESEVQGTTLSQFDIKGKTKLFKPRVEKPRSKREMLYEMEKQIYMEKENETFKQMTVADKEDDLDLDNFIGKKYYSSIPNVEEEDFKPK